MQTFVKMTWIELKLFLREPLAAFFTLVFPLMMLFIFGAIFGNEPAGRLGNRGNVDVSVPGYMAMIIGSVALMNIPVMVASYREKGVLRRLRATPLKPIVVLCSQVAVNLLMQLIGMFLLMVVGRLVYGLMIPEAGFGVLAAILFGGCSFFALGFVIAGLVSTSRTATAVGMVIYFPMLFLSGAAMPRELFPKTVKAIGEFLPLTHVVELIKGSWFGNGWSLISVAVLAGVLALSLFVSARTFRWE